MSAAFENSGALFPVTVHVAHKYFKFGLNPYVAIFSTRNDMYI